MNTPFASRRLFVLMAALLMSSSATLVFADDADEVDYRQHLMDILQEQLLAISMMADHRAPPDSLALHLRTLAATARAAGPAFENPAKGGRSKIEVWSHRQDFADRLSALGNQAEMMAQQAETAPTATMAASSISRLQCRACHDVYREPHNATPNAEKAGVNDEVEYRTHVMQTLNAQSQALGLVIATSVPSDGSSSLIQGMSYTAQSALKSFEPKALGGEARPSVWSNWPDFANRMQTFADGVSTASSTVKDKGLSEGLNRLSDSLTCKQCHDQYRDEVPAE